AVVFDSILNRKPAPVARWNTTAPADLERSIDKALEKEKRFRYQHASEIRTDLERLRRDLSASQHVVEPPATTLTPYESTGGLAQSRQRAAVTDYVQQRPIEVVAQTPTEVAKPRGLKKIFLLGFIPGVGALYNGEYKKAAIHVGVFFGLSMILDV